MYQVRWMRRPSATRAVLPLQAGDDGAREHEAEDQKDHEVDNDVFHVLTVVHARSLAHHPSGSAPWRSLEQVRGDDSERASYLRIDERELEAGGLN
jgi:hypothetical protein